jgi:hypothetical protein
MNARRILVGFCVLGAVLLVAAGAALLPRGPAPHPPNLSTPQRSPETWTPAPAPVAEDRTPEIRGHVLDANGDPVDGATVRLVSASAAYHIERDTKTDRGGAFSLAHVAPGLVRVVAEHGVDGVVTSAPLRVAELQTLELTLVLSAAGAVRGTVVDGQERPVAGALLSVEGMPWIVSATSDAAGAFRLTTVPAEATALVAVARGFRTGRARLGTRSDKVERNVRLVLTAADPIDGEVRDDEDTPMSARVVACEAQASEATTQSAADGTFQLPASAIGCQVVAEHAELAPSQAVQVVEGRHLVLRLSTGGGIAGVVVDDRGAAVSPFRVGIESFSPARGRGFELSGARSFADRAGAFRWDKLAPGTYVLTASSSERPPSRSGSVDVRGGVVTSGVRIVLAAGGSLMGRVTDEAHAPLGGVDLRFDQISRVLESEAVAQTDRAGRYSLAGAPAGPFTVRAHKDGFRVTLVSGLRVDSGSTLRRDITLVALDGGASMEIGGIGAGLAQTPDGLALRTVFQDDPAARAGLRAGDRVVSIDGEPTEGMSISDALQRIRGEPGTSVGVSVRRPETGEVVDLTIVRGKVVH